MLLQGSPYLLQGSPYHYNEVRTTTSKSVLLQQVCIATRKTVLCYKEDRITTLKSVYYSKSVILQGSPLQ